MKKIDLANIPIEQELIPQMKKNIKRMAVKGLSLSQYIRFCVTMHTQVLDRIEEMEEPNDKND